MKFGEIFRFELKYQLRHATTWLLFAALFLFGFIVLRIVTLADDIYLNAPSTITFFTIFAGMIWLVIGGAIAGEAATRDIQTFMHPLTFTTPVSKLSYLSARFMAALTLNASIFLGLFLALLLSYYTPGINASLIGPFRLASYLTNYFFIALPAVVAVTAIQFAFAALSGRARSEEHTSELQSQ